MRFHSESAGRPLKNSLLFIAVLFCATAPAAQFYVATDGSDANSGTRSKPFATLERARDEVRKLKGAGKLAKGETTIWLRGGDYFRTNALELTMTDSAPLGGRITWRAYKNETVRLLGGRKLSNATPVTNPAILERLSEAARANVVQFDLRALGMTNFGEMKSRGFGRPTAVAHCELFFDGRPMTLARWPNEGEWEHIAGFPTGQNDDHGGNIGKLDEGFFYSGDRIRRWRDTSNLWVHGYWAWDWANSYERVASIDLDRRLIRTAPPHGNYGFRKGQRIYFLNVLEELDQPGEWFLDQKNGVLYFWPPNTSPTLRAPSPPAGERVGVRGRLAGVTSDARNIAKPEILLSVLDESLLKLTDASHVTFRGLVLEGTRANAVEIRGGASNLIAGCVIRNVGDSGVTISGGSSHGALSCDIFDTGDGGVSLHAGDRKTLTPAGHFVENCHFMRQGRWSKCYVPAILIEGVGMRASHNLIHDHPHCAILFGGNDHLIEFNEIHRIALETGDVGAIYAGRDYTYRGNRIRNNFIHHTGGVGMGSMGVYMDDCVSGTEVFGNIFYKVHWAMFIGGGRDHRVENNIFVDCDPAVRADGRGLDKSPVWRGMVNDFMRKRLAEMPAPLYRERYPALKTLDRYYGPPDGPAIEGDAFTGVPPENNVIARNLCAGKWLDVGWHATPEMFRVENNLTNAATSFVQTLGDQSKASDFALKKDSPAWQLGFQKIPLSEIGLYRDELRSNLSGRVAKTQLSNQP